MQTHASRLKLIAVHGGTGSLADSVSAVRGLTRFACRWQDGSFLVARRTGLLLRRLLFEGQAGAYTGALQVLVIARLLESSVGDPADEAQLAEGQAGRIGERRLQEEFGHLGLPFAPRARRVRAGQLRAEAERTLEPLLQLLDPIEAALRDQTGRLATEEEARARIRELTARRGGADEILSMFESLRDMQETGGDLDSVASAALYTHWLRSEIAAAGGTLEHGRDYRCVAINYHESLLPLAAFAPAELFLADLPIGAFPDFEAEARALAGQGVRIARFEDHHPFTASQRAMLEQLVRDGILGFLDLSGPPAEGPDEAGEARCATDMVYANTVAGRPWNTAVAHALCRAAHAEDFMQDRTDLSRLLTALIKGGLCKTEFVQVLADALPAGDLMATLKARGWDRWAAEREHPPKVLEEVLRRNVIKLNLRRPAGVLSLGRGREPDGAASPAPSPRDSVCVLAALADAAEPGAPRIGVGPAGAFYSQAFPEADYLFYCYGSSILVARRLNPADLSFNLGALMGMLGGPGDGGHAGAAVCRPEHSPDYPHQLLGFVGPASFQRFVAYLAARLARAGHETVSIQTVSLTTVRPMMEMGRHLRWVVLAATLGGILLLLLHPGFRRAAILRSNEGFFSQLDQVEQAEEAESAEETEKAP